MKLEKRAMIIGVIWGLISFWFIKTIVTVWNRQPTTIEKIITLPAIFYRKIITPLYANINNEEILGIAASSNTLVEGIITTPMYLVFIISSIILGVVISYIISKIYLMVKK